VRNWFRKKQPIDSNILEENVVQAVDDESPVIDENLSSWQRLKKGMKKTRLSVMSGFAKFFSQSSEISDEFWDDLEAVLLSSDFGIKTTQKILDYLRELHKKHKQLDGEILKQKLADYLVELLTPIHHPFTIKSLAKPHVILMVGINGVGKTTTLAKIATRLQNDMKVMMAAGDTFRAAAIEQLQTWGERLQIPVISQSSGSDSAAVIFDALQSAQARGIDVLLADTAGRLHTQTHLLQELQKVKRVLQKLDASAPHDIIMVLDASIGQNALMQVRQFHEAMGLTGLVVTKLDGTAKGGILFAIAQEFKIPCYFIGIGEGVDDLRPFDPVAFVQAILE
jgi:fused signal recognition particle receptor